MAAQICEYCKHEKEDCYCSPNSTCRDYEPDLGKCAYSGDDVSTIAIASRPKIINGSKLTIGKGLQCVSVYNVDQHFNWFQKLMWKWAFGIKVEDFSEE